LISTDFIYEYEAALKLCQFYRVEESLVKSMLKRKRNRMDNVGHDIRRKLSETQAETCKNEWRAGDQGWEKEL